MNTLFDEVVDKRNNAGFTLVELVIVIIIIGILATLILVAFNGVQARAHDAIIKSDLRSFANKLQQYYVTNGQYPPVSPPSSIITSLELKATKASYKSASGWNTLLFCIQPLDPGARFVLAAVSKSENMYTYSSQGGLQQFTGTWNSSASPMAATLGIPNTPPTVWCSWAYSDSGGWNPNIITN